MPLPGSASVIDTYGGVLQNYAPVVDPTTDRDGPSMDQALEDCAQQTHCSATRWVRINILGGSPFVSIGSVNGWDSGTGDQPVVAKTGTGAYTLTFPTTVVDGLGNTQPTNLKWAYGSIEGNANFGTVNASVTSANVVTVYTAMILDSPPAALVAANMAGSTLLILVR